MQVRKGGLPPLERLRRDLVGYYLNGISLRGVIIYLTERELDKRQAAYERMKAAKKQKAA